MDSLPGSLSDVVSVSRTVVQPVVGLVMAQLGTSQGETELVLFSSVTTAVAVFVVLFVNRLLFKPAAPKQACCVTDFVQKRRANNLGSSIPPMAESAAPHGHGMEAFLHEVQHQLAAIQRELQTLKQERELVDHELIETSTQILQTIGASMMPLEDEPLIDSPVLVKPIPSRPLVDRPVIDLPKHQVREAPVVPHVHAPPAIRQPVVPSSSSPIPQSVTAPVPTIPVARQPFAAPVQAPTETGSVSPTRQQPIPQIPVAAVPTHTTVPMSVPSHASPRAPIGAPVGPPMVPTGDSSPRPAPAKATAPAPALQQQETIHQIPTSSPVQAAPKMSALAMARMKREQEQADSKGAPPPAAASNPFGKPKAGPFGASPLVK